MPQEVDSSQSRSRIPDQPVHSIEASLRLPRCIRKPGPTLDQAPWPQNPENLGPLPPLRREPRLEALVTQLMWPRAHFVQILCSRQDALRESPMADKRGPHGVDGVWGMSYDTNIQICVYIYERK